ncbi:MAG: hypothetical protein ACFE0J_11095 [Elainellaceae cyanobacterium]
MQMLCDTCQRKQACLPLQFAQTDQDVHAMLSGLTQCELRVESPQAKSSVLNRFMNRLMVAYRQAIARFNTVT